MSTSKVKNVEEKLKRLKLLIISTTKTNSAFAKRIGKDKSLITMLLNGTANLSWQVEESIISTFNVNRLWWEEGEGEMFKEDKYPGTQETATLSIKEEFDKLGRADVTQTDAFKLILRRAMESTLDGMNIEEQEAYVTEVLKLSQDKKKKKEH